MKIGLHELKSLVRQIINEGNVADNLKVLQQRYPNEANALAGSPFFDPNGQPTKWFKWLLPRFLPNPPKEEFPLDHAIDSVQRYAQNERALSDALRQQAFKEALAAAFPENFNSNKIRDPSQLTVQEMDDILEVFYEYVENKDDRLGIDYDAIDIEGDHLGKIGPWNIWMPTTRESSCAIVRVRDPATGKMKASPCTWCTTRTKESNLFYGYTARSDADIILYYLIKDNPEINNKDNEDYISVGFINGNLIAKGQTGFVTVKCDNKGLDMVDLKRIFGVNFTSITNLLEQKTKEIGGKHPAKAKIEAAIQSLEGFNYFIKGVGKQERAEIAFEVLRFGQSAKNHNVFNPEIKALCFKYASESKHEQILMPLVENNECPIHVFEDLSDQNINIQIKIASNRKCPTHVLEKLSNFHFSSYLALSIIKNPNCSMLALENLTPIIIKNETLWFSCAQNYECPPNILEKLSDYGDDRVKEAIASNPNCSPETFEKLYNLDDYDVNVSLSINYNCPPNILENLSGSDYETIRQSVALNENTPDYIIKKLCKDNRSKKVKESAIKAAQNRGIQLESLRRKIGKLIYTAR